MFSKNDVVVYDLSISALVFKSKTVYNWNKHPINNDIRELFYKYAEVKEVIQKFNYIVIGEIVNFTEKKSVTHFEYKKGAKKDFIADQVQVLSLANKIKRNYKRSYWFCSCGRCLF